MNIQKNIPCIIDGAKVLYSTRIDARHTWTRACKHTIGGSTAGKMAELAICQYDNESNVYLFGCNSDWITLTDTWHETVEDAMKQAEFEYAGTKQTWMKHEHNETSQTG